MAYRYTVYAFMLLLCMSSLVAVKASHPCSANKSLQDSIPLLTTPEKEFDLQQLLLEGFRRYDLNTYNIRRFGFTSNGGTERCIIVRYLVQCNDTDKTCTNEIFGSKCNIEGEMAEWSFLWSSFDTSTFVGRILLKLAVFDLRVFGFELCDVYQTPVTVTFVLNSTDPRIVPQPSCESTCKVLLDFTALLPGLSSEVDTTTTPEAIGYASHWNWKEENDFLAHEDTLITIFSILIVAATKLFLLAFSYEILQWIRKHSIHRKAHKWYYHYWAVQVLIVCTLSAVIYFELLKQHNKTALYIFIGSFGCDLLAFIFMLLITSKVLIWICSRAIISDFFGCKRSNICFCGLCEIKDSEYEAINPDSGRNFLIEMITLDNSSAKEEANGNSSPEVAVEGNSSGVVTQETSPTDITPAPAATEGEIQPDSENSFVKECVPPPLTLLYYCFPCCCCFCKLRCFSVFWLWCFPIVYYSSKRWKCFCCIYHGKSVNDRDCWCCACCIPCCSCISLSSNSSKDDPVCVKMLKCHACVKAREDFSCNIKNKEDWEKCRKHWHTCWTAITNIASLVIFLAFVSYLSQALPAIVISYYLSPTASLIRLGFFEVMIVVMLFEVAYVLFLMDKLTWLCYFNKKKEIPKEIEPESDSEDEHRKSKDEKSNKKENTLISKYIKKIQRGEKQEDLLIYDCQCEYCYTCTRQRKKLTKCCCCKAERNVRLLDCKKVECCDAIKQCHCLFVVTLIQILTMLFITGLSAVLLFFLLNVIIEQTSGANNEFRDILAIVPTIALNLWLLFKEGNVFHAVKNIVGKANKSVDHDPLSTAEEGRSAVHMHHTLSSHHRGSVY